LHSQHNYVIIDSEVDGMSDRMEVEDLAEGLTAGEIGVSVWQDNETGDVFIQYGYASISMPLEDFLDFVAILSEAAESLTQKEGQG